MVRRTKILIAGVGGQGVVYLTDLIVEAAILEGVDVSSSEIYGLTQRGGSVTSGITLGENTFGFIGKADVDVLLGLETLEAQRCLEYLHEDSLAIVDSHQIIPNTVHSGKASYPDTRILSDYLKSHIRKSVFITEDLSFKPIFRNLYILGKFSLEPECPFTGSGLEQAIRNKARKEWRSTSLEIFQLGRKMYKAPVIDK